MSQRTSTARAIASASLLEFCSAGTLSLRSRVELLEQVCGLVAAAHASHSAFREFDARTIRIDYDAGALAICIGEPLTFVDPSTQRPGTSLRIAAEVIRASNVIFLGNVVREVLGELAMGDVALTAIWQKAMHLDTPKRYASVHELRDALRAWLMTGQGERLEMRWSWA